MSLYTSLVITNTVLTNVVGFGWVSLRRWPLRASRAAIHTRQVYTPVMTNFTGQTTLLDGRLGADMFHNDVVVARVGMHRALSKVTTCSASHHASSHHSSGHHSSRHHVVAVRVGVHRALSKVTKAHDWISDDWMVDG